MVKSDMPSKKYLIRIIRMIVRGYTINEISEELGITSRTVYGYKYIINWWTFTKTRRELVKWAIDNKVIELRDLDSSHLE